MSEFWLGGHVSAVDKKGRAGGEAGLADQEIEIGSRKFSHPIQGIGQVTRPLPKTVL